MDIRDYPPSGEPMDLDGVISSECPCGCNLFRTVVVFDPETYEIAMYGLDGECLECGTRLTLPTPLDIKE